MIEIEAPKIRPQMMEPILAYVNTGRIPGSFLQAIITNNLKLAFGRSDPDNKTNLEAFVNYFIWEVPSRAWGSPEAMDAWANQGGLEGSK